MAGLMDKMGALKAKQGEAEKSKAEEKAKLEAAEKTKTGKEGRRGELGIELSKLNEEMEATSQEAQEAEQALKEVSDMEAQSELDPEVAAQLAEVKQEAQAARAKFDERQARMEALKAEMAGMESGEQEEASVEEAFGASIEAATEGSKEKPEEQESETEAGEREIAKNPLLYKKIENLLGRTEKYIERAVNAQNSGKDHENIRRLLTQEIAFAEGSTDAELFTKLGLSEEEVAELPPKFKKGLRREVGEIFKQKSRERKEWGNA